MTSTSEPRTPSASREADASGSLQMGWSDRMASGSRTREPAFRQGMCARCAQAACRSLVIPRIEGSRLMEPLFRAAVRHTTTRFATTFPRGSTPAEQFRAQLELPRHLLTTGMEFWAVMNEITLCPSDGEVLVKIMRPRDDQWFGYRRGLVAHGVADGSLAAMIAVAIQGLSMSTLGFTRRNPPVSARFPAQSPRAGRSGGGCARALELGDCSGALRFAQHGQKACRLTLERAWRPFQDATGHLCGSSFTYRGRARSLLRSIDP